MDIVSLLAVASGLASSLLTALTEYRARRLQQVQLRSSEEDRFAAALNSADPIAVGAFLTEVVGEFNLLQYSTSSVVRSRVDSYIDRIQEYLGTDEQAHRESQNAEPPQHRADYLNAYSLDVHYPADIRRYRTPDTWEGMARLRRDLELLLKSIGERVGLRVDPGRGARSLLESLSALGHVPPSVLDDLRYVIPVLNSAIHGGDLEPDQPEEVIFLGGRAMRALAALHETQLGE